MRPHDAALEGVRTCVRAYDQAAEGQRNGPLTTAILWDVHLGRPSDGCAFEVARCGSSSGCRTDRPNNEMKRHQEVPSKKSYIFSVDFLANS